MVNKAVDVTCPCGGMPGPASTTRYAGCKASPPAHIRSVRETTPRSKLRSPAAWERTRSSWLPATGWYRQPDLPAWSAPGGQPSCQGGGGERDVGGRRCDVGSCRRCGPPAWPSRRRLNPVNNGRVFSLPFRSFFCLFFRSFKLLTRGNEQTRFCEWDVVTGQEP
jgi:hypothetical protein